MSFHDEYKRKLTTPNQAVQCITSGDWIDYGVCANHPVALDKALAARTEELLDIKIRGMNALWLPEIAKVAHGPEHFTWHSWAMMESERKMQKLGMCYYAPLRYSELPRFYRENLSPVHVAMFQVGPMDEHGNFNFGPSCSHMAAVVENAQIVIVEVNRNMPRCLGGFEECVNIKDVDYIVEHDSPMVELLAKPGTQVDEAVAKYVVENLRGGECLQLGIGAMPNAVGKLIAQSDLKDFGVNTEMYVDAFVELALAGKITGKYKKLDKGRQTYSFATGSKKLYEYLDDNRECMTAPIDYVNDIRTISAQDNYASICGAVEVDLYGQVSAESNGFRQISGAGGQQDFVLGAYLSKGGKSFICCSSTYTDKEGKQHSRIVPSLASGTAVTEARPNTMYVVTEYGCVNLKGMSTWERAEALIGIANPIFRDELIEQARAQSIWRKCNK
ncbi:MAG: butyryl-CoA:acetate CoA-transferase [Phascolarctobacterium sp.]|nr:butyryl-CoA:acetate CoA-transferase [Phascolarctobacterium sp.]